MGYSKKSHKETGGGQNPTKSGLPVSLCRLSSSSCWAAAAKMQFLLVFVSTTFGPGNQRKPYDFKGFPSISGHFPGRPAWRAAGRGRLADPASFFT